MKNLIYISLFTLISCPFFYTVDQSRLSQLKNLGQGRNVPQHSSGSHPGPAGHAQPVVHSPAQVVPDVVQPVIVPQQVQPVVAAPVAPILPQQVIENVVPTPSPTPVIMSGPESSANELATVQKRLQELENALNVFKTEVKTNFSTIEQSMNVLRQATNAGSAQNDKTELEKLKVQIVKIDQEINAMKKNFLAFSTAKK